MFLLQDNALTTVERALMFVDGVDGDEITEHGKSMLVLAINAASDMIETYCRRNFGYGIYTQYERESSTDIVLDVYPAHKLISVDGREESANYFLDVERGIVRFRSTERQGTFIYEAGYVLPKDATDDNPQTLPNALEIICMRLVDSLWVSDEGFIPSFNSLKLGDFSIGQGTMTTTDTHSVMPKEITESLKIFRSWRL